MKTEEKARAYDEALKKAKEIKEKIMFSHLSTESCKAVSEYIDTLIPELAEAANRQAALEQPYKWEGDDGSFGVTPLFVMSNIRSAFKAGAKWMAEQGYTTETRVDRTPMNGPIGICLHLHDSTGFKIDDKVIVQIRKKQ